ncbi:protoporphyrinogen/coproporphyrinogen oxidase [Gemelliphila palaticanis]|uniref:FAD-dependent oxidoreductase n=1 Tax=Gemelliphila palaticanis TaxID=81950 RepID=A0ABX2T2A6_9BACL|nr:FAD-dependent oxidoreductase [Gemella palaticanis]MBF0715659.1 FAD-dependent oxidoreductase [Gemella palaticanis]NYS47589.1 FAD-dependent oxidoreductase [Gemella palaticanis]
MKNIAVIGGGLSGLTFTYFLDKLATIKSKKINIDIIEQNSDFAKSKICNFQYNQEIYDNGWHNTIKDNGILFQMILELGLYRYLIESKQTVKVIYDGNDLKNIPEKIFFGYPLDKGQLLSSDIFNLKEKISIFMKLHKNSKLYDISKITVEDFFLSKINSTVYDKLIEPILTSHYGSDISKQSFSLVLPDLAFATIKNSDVENVINEMYKSNISDNILYGKEYRLKFTLKSLIESLESHLSNKVFREFNSKVTSIEKHKKGYIITYGDKKRYYDQVIITSKHTDFLSFFEDDKRLKKYYKELTFTSNIVATLLVKKENLNINSNIGDVIFSEENKYISKVEYVSNKWIDIKSQNIHLLRVYINRQDRVNEILDKSDCEIENIILKELSSIHKNLVIEKAFINKIDKNYIYANIKYSKYINEIEKYLSTNYDKIYFIGNSKKAINLENTIIESREVARYIVEKI